MKFAQPILTALSLILCLIVAVIQPAHAVLAGICAVASLTVWLNPEARLGTPTLALSILARKVMTAFRTKLPPLMFFSTDFGKVGNNTAEPAKWQQEVVSWMALKPTATSHTPGEDLEAGALNVKDYLTDVYMRIDRAAKCVFTIPTVDSVKYILDGAIDSTLAEAGKALAKYVLMDILATCVTPANFTQSITETVNNADFDTLRAGRVALNLQGAGEPRYGLAGSQFLSNIGDDPAVSSGDYHNQRNGADPYMSLVNIEGFNEVKEFPEFPADNSTIGTFTAVAATNVITTSTTHGLNIGDRVRVTTTAADLPAGMAIDTDYFVITVPSPTTITVSATSGGAVLDITDAGTGTHTIQNFGNLNAFLFEDRAIHVTVRQLVDNIELAKKLGIPVTVASHTEVDPETGLAFTVFMWLKPNTQDIFIAMTVAYGCKGGRGLAAANGTDPGSLAAGAGTDYAGLRVIQG